MFVTKPFSAFGRATDLVCPAGLSHDFSELARVSSEACVHMIGSSQVFCRCLDPLAIHSQQTNTKPLIPESSASQLHKCWSTQCPASLSRQIKFLQIEINIQRTAHQHKRTQEHVNGKLPMYMENLSCSTLLSRISIVFIGPDHLFCTGSMGVGDLKMGISRVYTPGLSGVYTWVRNYK